MHLQSSFVIFGLVCFFELTAEAGLRGCCGNKTFHKFVDILCSDCNIRPLFYLCVEDRNQIKLFLYDSLNKLSHINFIIFG